MQEQARHLQRALDPGDATFIETILERYGQGGGGE
jgi:hypothetical protein